MKKIYVKGQPGYCLHHKKIYGLISLLGFLMIIAIFTVSYIVLGTAKNYFNIASVIILLPTTKFFVQYLMLPWNFKINEQKFEEMNTMLGAIPTYCELLITGAETRFEILYLVIGPNDEILAYTSNLKSNTEKFKTAITNFLNYYQFDAKPQLFLKEDEFFDECLKLASNYPEITTDQVEHMKLVYEKLSIMSI